MTALGSGIYSPSGPLNYTYNTTGGSELIIAEIPILSASTGFDLRRGERMEEVKKEVKEVEEVDGGRTTYQFENMTGYSKVPLLKGQYEQLELCHNETFCCEASYSLVGEEGEGHSYYLVAYQGLRGLAIPGMMIPIQLCGIVQLCCDQAEDCPVCPPGGQSPSERGARFDFLRLHSRDFRAGSLVLPSVLEVTGQLADWNKITFDSRQADEGENKLVWNKRNQFKYVKKEKSFQTIER